MSVSRSITHTVRASVPIANANVQNIKTRIEGFLGSIVDSELGLTPGTTVVVAGTTVVLNFGAVNVEVVGQFPFDGTWTKT